MNTSSKQRDPLRETLSHFEAKTLEFLLSSDSLRRRFIKFFDRALRRLIMSQKKYPPKVQEDKYYMVKNIFLAVDKALRQAKNAPMVRKSIINTVVRHLLMSGHPQIKKFIKEFGTKPPFFLTISPGELCNLNCAGCYANSSSTCANKLDWDILDRIITEKTNLWGSYFTVISGGEPLLYGSQGKGIIDLAKKHPDNYFLMYTNGTLINKALAKKMAEIGNISPAISVEGFEKETDERRGKGIHKQILLSMANLRKAGVPFGISFTATKNNAHLINDEFVNYYFNQHGVSYGWIFQFMPIGRANTLDLMVDPKSRVMMYRNVQHLVRDKEKFLIDFWNCGPLSNGCISAGRHGGYLYIEWNGNVTPCVFNPYSPVNIYDVYKKGGTLNDVLQDPFFVAIRQWQKDYALDKPPEEMGNWIVPCAIKDHYDVMLDLLQKHKPQPIDEAAKNALADPEYQEKLKEYGKNVAEATDGIWRGDYCGKCKRCPPGKGRDGTKEQN